MREYWKEHSKESSAKEMMLDSKGELLVTAEVDEIMSYLPPLSNKDVIELGAGIGRYTGLLAEKCKSLVAVDFMEGFLKKNKELNCHHGNINYKCVDVTKLELPLVSADLVFSNWLMMYLSDDEVKALVASQLSWLREGGYCFARESCFRQSGDLTRSFNPSKYRAPADYERLFRSVSLPTEDDQGVYIFELVLSKSVDAYIRLKNNNSQIVWLLQKVRVGKERYQGYHTFQQFLDSRQYSKESILRYEKVFGQNFVSTGGLKTTQEFVSMLDLKKGQKVLDVGAGIGGSAFYMAKEYGVNVLGVDLSSNMISIALERVEQMAGDKSQVKFEVADVTKRQYPCDSFDVIYSRDTILHIQDKPALFSKFYSWLKPGGKVMISDYCCKDGELSEEYKAYVRQRGYFVVSPQQYGQLLNSAGFTAVRTEDRTEQFVEVLKGELCQTEKNKEEFIAEFTEDGYNTIVNGWKDKLRRCGMGDQRWALFYGEKPDSSQPQ
ncbi:uncharacterized protein LOC135475181 isoform X2 [Liolophura sinensis]